MHSQDLIYRLAYGWGGGGVYIETSITNNTPLNLFLNWSEMNALTVNIQKTKSMFFGTRSKVKKAKNVKLCLRSTQLQLVPSYKYLGFTLDFVLSYSNHISVLLNTIAHKAYVLSKIRRFITEYSAIKIFKSMILPYFDYADIVYDKANQNDRSG